MFSRSAATDKDSAKYTAKDIEVLEGLEPVRRRPAMYIGGTDEHALHHLVAEVFDNAMDEAVAGFASRIEIELSNDNTVTIFDNGRGIPVDPHPKFKNKSALEVIVTTLHSGGKFSNKVYHTAGGLHGVGISVVNALSDKMSIEVYRDKTAWIQEYSCGVPTTKLKKIGPANNKRGTKVTFHPDPEIFGDKGIFKAKRLYELAKSKAYLYKGVEIRWSCPAELKTKDVPEQDTIHFPNGIQDYLTASLEGEKTVTTVPFVGEAELAEKNGRVEWALHWPLLKDGFTYSYCNTVATPLGGSHEIGLRAALMQGIRGYSERVNNKKAEQITGDDVTGEACIVLSLFYKNPQFQGQTKEKLVNKTVPKDVENAISDHFDHWLSSNPEESNKLLDFLIARAEDRLRRKKQKEINRKNIIQKLRLPGKLADCTAEESAGTEIFLVEGDSAGGSAKQARDRKFQAVLPLRGKILNVASASVDKIKANQEIRDMEQAFGCGSGEHFDEKQLRYEKVIIMTDADVDGDHIASLLMTYFYKEMRGLITKGHLYLAQPPLYRITQGSEVHYAADDAEKEKLVKELSKSRKTVDISRFKGLGEMTPSQLKETTMNIATRSLLRVDIEEGEATKDAETRVEQLMGKKPELRFKFIQEQSQLQGKALLERLDI